MPLPTLSNGRISDLLLYGTWNAHGGDPWKFDLDLAAAKTPVIYVDYSGMTKAGQWFAEKAFDAWAATTGIGFSTSTPPSGKHVQIIVDDEKSGASTSKTAFGDGEIYQARVNVSRSWISGDEYEMDAYPLRTFIHEIGHGLGLGHPANYGAQPNDGDNFATDATFANDSWQTTMMSYYSQSENTTISATRAYVMTPQVADLIAMRELYGATGTLRTGDTTYGVGSTAGDYYDNLEENWASMSYTIVDDGGVDTIDFSTGGRDFHVDLRQEAFSSVGKQIENMAIARGTVIENFRAGSGDDTVVGNGARNRLEGGAGNDRLTGLGGADTLIGDPGRDTLIGSGGGDTLQGGSGSDVLKGGSGNDRLTGDAGQDRLFGGTGNDRLSGGDRDDRIQGDGGNDTLVGNAGADELAGGNGNDTLNGGADNDRLLGQDGTDTIIGGAGRDRLLGGADRDTLRGDAGVDMLSGGTGNDRLFGGGGTDDLNGGDGNDVIDGGGGNDILSGGRGADRFVFAPGSGRDVIADWGIGADVLDLAAWGIDTFRQVKNLATHVEDDLVLELGPKSELTLAGVTLDEIQAADVILSVA
ncbi:M10 family metallopeptidase C-terminal domain-containing protein [Tropicimonas aquimaris]|uniref:M10 family metallopeptidase C-terminal domain-containing protein n=1 Tax=Tropicimonas aquimaris TaxID=914152 RepID=A0ABW3IVA9_9RHOB